MTQTLTQQTGDLNSLSLVAWRIRRSRTENRETQINRQLMARLHDEKAAH